MFKTILSFTRGRNWTHWLQIMRLTCNHYTSLISHFGFVNLVKNKIFFIWNYLLFFLLFSKSRFSSSLASLEWELFLTPIPGTHVLLYVTVRLPSVVEFDPWNTLLHFSNSLANGSHFEISTSLWLFSVLPKKSKKLFCHHQSLLYQNTRFYYS